jgi:CDP-diacylglycerol--glycerol-3-phosphate 3-phosphatidyltransferase
MMPRPETARGPSLPQQDSTTMTMIFDTAQWPVQEKPDVRLDAPFLGASSLIILKPRLRGIVRPLAASVARAGFTANQVTFASLAGSLVVGGGLCVNSDNTALFALLALWLPIKTMCAALDGTLAVEFGQRSRLGGILNEAGDILSDIALFAPLAFVQPFPANSIVFLIMLIVVTELAGIIGPLFGSERRLEGPLGKVDRSIILLILGVAIAILGDLPASANALLPVLYGGLVLTIWNRLRFAIADERKAPL